MSLIVFNHRFDFWLYVFEFWKLEVILLNLFLPVHLYPWFLLLCLNYISVFLLVLSQHLHHCLFFFLQFIFSICIIYDIFYGSWRSVCHPIGKLFTRNVNTIIFLTLLHLHFYFIPFSVLGNLLDKFIYTFASRHPFLSPSLFIEIKSFPPYFGCESVPSSHPPSTRNLTIITFSSTVFILKRSFSIGMIFWWQIMKACLHCTQSRLH